MPGPALAVAILASTALGLVAWKALAPARSKGAAFPLTLAALGMAFGAWAWIVPGGDVNWLPAFQTDDTVRTLGAFFLGLTSLAWFSDSVERRVSHLGRLEQGALVLFAACGGLMAISAANLLVLWVGMELYTLSQLFLASGEDQAREARATVRALGIAASLLGVVFLYAGTGTLDFVPLGQALWEHGGPHPATVYAGAGLIIGGIGLVSGLLPPYGQAGSRSMTAPFLGLAGLMRLCPFALGALSWEWSRALILAAVAAWGWGWFSSLRAKGLASRLGRLAVAQQGCLLLALGLAFRAEGVAALVSALPAYGLAQVILVISLRRLAQASPGSVAAEPTTGLLRRDPWLGVPLLVAILSYAGMPGTLGFVARAQLLWAAQGAGMFWLAALALLGSILCGVSYLRIAMLLIDGRAQGDLPPVPCLRERVVLALASLGLVAMGLYPMPLVGLALRIVGA